MQLSVSRHIQPREQLQRLRFGYLFLDFGEKSQNLTLIAPHNSLFEGIIGVDELIFKVKTDSLTFTSQTMATMVCAYMLTLVCICIFVYLLKLLLLESFFIV